MNDTTQRTSSNFITNAQFYIEMILNDMGRNGVECKDQGPVVVVVLTYL